jgi:hypothetical protein
MRARLELALLGMTGLVVVAFVLSFAFGIGRPGADALPADPGSARRAAADYMNVPAAAGRVEVLNRSGRAGMARLATERLRARGYDVVYFGNAPASAPDSSVVFDRVGRPEIARGAAAQLGIGRTATQIDTTLYVDATVIIGVEWERGGAGAAGDTTAAALPDRPNFRERVRRLFSRG